MKDLDIIKQIEKELNVQLENLDGQLRNISGYILNKDDHIIEYCFSA